MSEAGKGTEKKSTSGASSGAASSISSIFSEEPLFSSSHVLQALESSQADLLGAKPKVAPNVPIFLAAVLEHVTAQVLNAAGKRSLDEVRTVPDANAGRKKKKPRIDPKHIEEIIGEDDELQQLVNEVVEQSSAGRSDALDAESANTESEATCSGSAPSAASSDAPRAGLSAPQASANDRSDKHEPLVVTIMGLPGSAAAGTFSFFQGRSSNETARLHVFGHEKEHTLLSAKAENPAEISLAWHIHCLSTGMGTLDHCFNTVKLGGGTPATRMAFSDASPVGLFGKALLDFRKGRLTDYQMNCYRTFFNNMVAKSGLAIRARPKGGSPTCKVLNVFVASEPSVAHRNLVEYAQKTTATDRSVVPLVDLDILNGIYFELVLQTCAFEKNFLIVSNKVATESPEVVYKRIVSIASGAAKLPLVEFKNVSESILEQAGGDDGNDPALLCQSRPWRKCTNSIVYDGHDVVVLESYSDLKQGEWPTRDWDTPMACGTVYVNSKFFVQKASYATRVIFEHLSRGQDVVIYMKV
jgi:hypothetical protein